MSLFRFPPLCLLLILLGCSDGPGSRPSNVSAGGLDSGATGGVATGGTSTGGASGTTSEAGGGAPSNGGNEATASGGTPAGGAGGQGSSQPGGAGQGGMGGRPDAGAAGGDSGMGGADAASVCQSASDTQLGPDDVWGMRLDMPLVNPVDHGATVDDDMDDTDALRASVDALPDDGGVILFPAGTLRKHLQQWQIRKSHVLLWSPNRRGTLHGVVEPRVDADECGTRQQATIFQETIGGGVYGLRLTSNANERMSCAEDAQIVLDGVNGTEIVGVEVDGAATNGVFIWARASEIPASRNVFLEGNYFHHTWADSVHHTRGTRRSACWRNTMFNEEPSKGDDGLACVTYSLDGARCGEMEWWDNVYLGGAHGRGLAVVGGEDILIHHNWIIGSAAAGLIVASESSYTTPGSDRIRMTDNWIIDSPNGTVDNGHSAILVSGNNEAAEPIRDVTVAGNVVINPAGGLVQRAEGNYVDVEFDNSTDPTQLPGPRPTLGDVEVQDTEILKTRDVSFVIPSLRDGLFRIHLRRANSESSLESRFEYVVRGTEDSLCAWLGTLSGLVHPVETRTVGSESYTLLLSEVALELPLELSGVTFDELRAGDRDGTLTWLWARVDRGAYAD